MKKKLLSLVLAGAMVASTSVSAFADAGKEYNILGNEDVEAPITVTGDIQNGHGDVLPSTIGVTVPTAAAFTVTSEGNFTSAPIKITSKSDEKVQVAAYSFTDSSENQNITIVSEGELPSQNNTETNKFMSLKLVGDNTVYFKSQKGKSGIYKQNGTEYGLTESPLLGTVTQTNPLILNLQGDIKKDSDTYAAPGTAIRDKFNLVLKISRVKKDPQA